MVLALPSELSGLIDWIIRTATIDDSGDRLLGGVCECLCRHGLPLWRVNVAVPAIDPQIRGATVSWCDGTITLETAAHGFENEEVFRRTPIFSMRSRGLSFERWNVARSEGCDLYPALHALNREGCTDYAMFIVEFSASTSLAGTAISIATRHPTGFTKDDIAIFQSIVPALGLAIYRHMLLRTATQALETYLGPMSGANVLAGQIVRGQGRTINAAILIADLTGFTTLVDRENGSDVVRWLNDHLEALVDPVIENGGEILKFLGDGFIAIFPLNDVSGSASNICNTALRAAQICINSNSQLNEHRASAGQPMLSVDIALHFGEVVYGNVGSVRRLDFTAIGRAINEVSRIEKLCDVLDCRLLLSEDFAMLCGNGFKPLGLFKLRGVEKPQTLFTIVEI